MHYYIRVDCNGFFMLEGDNGFSLPLVSNDAASAQADAVAVLRVLLECDRVSLGVDVKRCLHVGESGLAVVYPRCDIASGCSERPCHLADVEPDPELVDMLTL